MYDIYMTLDVVMTTGVKTFFTLLTSITELENDIQLGKKYISNLSLYFLTKEL